jgi:hypothetical protein
VISNTPEAAVRIFALRRRRRGYPGGGAGRGTVASASRIWRIF